MSRIPGSLPMPPKEKNKEIAATQPDVGEHAPREPVPPTGALGPDSAAARRRSTRFAQRVDQVRPQRDRSMDSVPALAPTPARALRFTYNRAKSQGNMNVTDGTNLVRSGTTTRGD